MTQEPLHFEIRKVPGKGRELLFINGYGGNFKQPGVKWYMNRFKEHGLDVTYVQLPTLVDDFRKDVLEPCMELEGEMGEHVSAGFSFGGLTLAYMKGARRRIFLSPFWGLNEKWSGNAHKAVVKILSVIRKPILPRHFDKEDAGELAVDDDLIGIPDYVSFRTIEQFFEAQEKMPAPMIGDAVFYSPDDRIISTNIVEERGAELHPYRGGHMFYLTRDRKDVMRRILHAVDEGFDQIHSAN